jgi:glycine betaine/proline transport system permease protein
VTILAQAGSTDPGVLENEVLDEFEIPFGAWIDQAVDWIDNNLGVLLDVIEWPFQTLIDTLVNDFLIEISWVWFVLGMFLTAALVRNIKVGVFVAGALIVCGLLGNAYWLETARTIGFIGVAVILCVIIGIPIGIACGRVDSIWAVVRPLLDAMQVVHSFVYMLPFIFFFGIGETSATMVTMIFALPPLIRLTNLGIRQVPEDVVEASRAYGASESKVLIDVQLPLARPAIMTGINQTLLLAISMLGIAAIMGAGGLGRLLFRALSNQDVALAASGGLAFFLVAVVLDRMSQKEDTDSGNLFRRIHQAWAHRRDPGALLPETDETSAVVMYKPVDRFAAVAPAERLPMLATLVGGALALVSVLLEWTSDAGKMSAYGRRVDEDLAGSSFNGLAASGGSWFGYIVAFLAVFVVLAVVWAYRKPGEGPRWLTADGAAIASIALLVLTAAHLLGSPSELALDPGTGLGVILAVFASAVATAGALLWARVAPHSPLRPLSADIAWGPLIGVGIAVLVLVMGAFSGWSIDKRADVVITPELQERLDDLRQQALDRPEDAGAIAADISATLAEAQAEGSVIIDGLDGDGPRLGLWTLLAGLAAAAAVLPAIGLLGRDEHKQWRWSTITAGLGAGIAVVSLAWIATQVRSADPNYVSGIGAFFAMAGGFFIVASVSGVLGEFRRSKVYEDDDGPAEAPRREVEESAEVGV